jgi:4-hydroxythreonine-4-phosphate dehydrogenase
MKEKIRIGITHGDFNGINYEIIMKALSDTSILEFFVPVIYGSSKAAAYYKKVLGMENFNFNLITDAAEAQAKKANIINVADNIKVEIGFSSQLARISSVKALDMAVEDLQNDKIDVIVTCPINRSSIHPESNGFHSHTEYFASKFNVKDHMILMVNELMRIGFVTGKIPVEEALKTINKDLIISKLSLIDDSLKNDFLIRAPRIAVLSLNPYSKDSNLSGKEEGEIINPAIDESRRNGILAFGAYPADEFFADGEFSDFDAILAMYHDQGAIPFRSIGLSGGVYYTAGLPIVRTSPAHGTRYSIAGKGLASPASFREALFLAMEIHENRKIQDEIGGNPLKIKTDYQKKTLE